MNPSIPEELARRFQLGAVAFDEGRRNMVEAMRLYREEFQHCKGFSVMQMYADFAALTAEETGEPRVTARTVRYYYEAVDDVPDDMYQLFVDGHLTFDHCAVDKQITTEQGIERGYALRWAAQDIGAGRRAKTVKAMWLHFQPNHDKSPDMIRLINWERRVDLLAKAELPVNGLMSEEWKAEVRLHVDALARLAKSLPESR
jgi:hypothetical protein